ncbi:MAG: hypothetical protein V4574_10825 [Pseudomonadota bacterium]
MLRRIALSLAIATAPVGAVAPVAAHAQVAPADQAAIDLALARGQLLYAYDQAAWHGTDDMLKKVEKPGDKIGGYIVDGPAATPTLIFFDKDEADPHAVYVAQFRNNRLVSGKVLGARDDRTLSPERKAMIAARARAATAWSAAKPVYCSEARPNTVVLPPERPGGPFLVYIMTPQTVAGAYPFGGHFRVEVNADGTTGASRSFTRTCLTISGPGVANSLAIVVTHLLDPVPTEIHVFTSLAAHQPVVVSTRDKARWWVTGDAIERKDE